MRWLRLLPLFVIGVVVAALVWRLANPPDTAIESAMVGSKVPQFAAPAAIPGGKPISSADLADGRPKLVNFFASWCVPCVGEAPVLWQLRKQGVPIVGIAVRDKPADLARFLSENRNPFVEIGADRQSNIQLAFGSAGVPETFVVDGRGMIRMQHIGPIQPDDIPALMEAIRGAR